MLTRFIYPLSLREKISYHIQNLYPNIKHKDIPLEFNKNIKFDISLKDVRQKSLVFNGFHDLSLSKSLIRLGRKGGVLIEVGANFGYFSCLWAAQNLKNRVISFEAIPFKLDLLRNNVCKNIFEDRITIVPLAIGKEKGNIKLNLNPEYKNTYWGAFIIKDDSETVDVEVDTLDKYTTDKIFSKIEVLKIDTEGLYTEVLVGAKQLIKAKRINHIFYEHNPTKFDQLNNDMNEAKEFLKKFDYSIKPLSPTSFYSYPK